MLLYRLRNRHVLLLDLMLLALAPAVALALRLDFAVRWAHLPALVMFTVLALAVKVPVFFYFRLYNRYWRYASMDDLFTILLAVAGSSLVVAVLFYGAQVLGVWPILDFPRSVPLLDAGLTLVAAGGVRFGVRAAEHQWARRRHRRGYKRVLIVGAGNAGSLLVKELRTSNRAGLEPVGFVDDDPAKRGMRIHDVPILGARAELAKLIEQVAADEVIIAMPSAPGKVIREIVQACEAAAVPSRTLPGLAELASGEASASRLRPVNIEDLLRREPVETDLVAVRAMLAGKRVMVTGAGGSIGSELCRQIARCGPAALIALGHGENSLFALAAELRSPDRLGRACAFGQPGAGCPTPGCTGRQCPLQVVVADVRDRARLEAVFAQHAPQVIFHAAAHKHVPLMEDNVEDAVSNNVRGTRHLVEVAEAHGVERFVLISSDKAVNPVSVMGVTKRVAELVVTSVAKRSRRPYVAVRFGNVLGSRGSVVPLFTQQIANGGPITLTHPDMQRYFMTIPEAVQLVLQAAVLGEPGNVFVLDMGQPVKLIDLAMDLVKLSGLQLERDIDIIYTGVRPGEKLFEELFGGQEQAARTRHTKIFVAPNGHHPANSLPLSELIDKLCEAAERGQRAEAYHWLKRIVPEYHPAANSSLAACVPHSVAPANPYAVTVSSNLAASPGD